MTSYASVEIFMPMTSCGRELAVDQYAMMAKSSFDTFLTSFGSDKVDYSKHANVLFAQPANMLPCCRKDVLYPRIVIITQSSGDNCERVLPTALPSPMKASSVIEWYGRQHVSHR